MILMRPFHLRIFYDPMILFANKCRSKHQVLNACLHCIIITYGYHIGFHLAQVSSKRKEMLFLEVSFYILLRIEEHLKSMLRLDNDFFLLITMSVMDLTSHSLCLAQARIFLLSEVKNKFKYEQWFLPLPLFYHYTKRGLSKHFIGSRVQEDSRYTGNQRVEC